MPCAVCGNPVAYNGISDMMRMVIFHEYLCAGCLGYLQRLAPCRFCANGFPPGKDGGDIMCLYTGVSGMKTEPGCGRDGELAGFILKPLGPPCKSGLNNMMLTDMERIDAAMRIAEYESKTGIAG